MIRKAMLVALGSLVITGCGAPASTPGFKPVPLQVASEPKDAVLEAEAYGLLNRWLLDRNYVVANVAKFKQRRPGEKVAVRGVFWSTYRTQRGILFRNGHWNLALRDENDSGATGRARFGRGRYDRDLGPSYHHYSGTPSRMLGDQDAYDDAMYDDYDEDYTDDCSDPMTGPGYGTPQNNWGRQRRRGDRLNRGYDDGLDCYPDSGTGGPGYGRQPGYDNGRDYRSGYNSYPGLHVPLLRIADNSKSRNFKVFNGERALAFIDGDKVKEVRLMRDGSIIWKTLF